MIIRPTQWSNSTNNTTLSRWHNPIGFHRMLSTTEPGSHESMQVPTTSTAFNASQPRTHNTVPCSVESSSRYLSAHLLTFHTKWNVLDKHYDITSRYGLRYRYQHTVRKAVYKHWLLHYRTKWSNTQSQRRLDDSFRGVLACVRSSHRSRYFYNLHHESGLVAKW